MTTVIDDISSEESAWCLQELEDAAFKVSESQRQVMGLLEQKAAALAEIGEEYETKKKEVRSLPLTLQTPEQFLSSAIADHNANTISLFRKAVVWLV